MAHLPRVASAALEKTETAKAIKAQTYFSSLRTENKIVANNDLVTGK
jgi:hypothetical protein